MIRASEITCLAYRKKAINTQQDPAAATSNQAAGPSVLPVAATDRTARATRKPPPPRRRARARAAQQCAASAQYRWIKQHLKR